MASGMSRSELYRQNIKALKPFLHPDLHAELEKLTLPMMAFTGEPGTPGFNLHDEAGRACFPGDEPSFTRQRLDAFHARPTALFEFPEAGPVYPANSDEFVNFLTRKLERELVPSLGARYRGPAAAERAGFLLLFGGGVGTHILELVQRYDFVDLILCEDDIVLFHSSLFVTDWTAIVDALEQRGGRLFFIHAETPDAFHGQVSGIVQHRHQALAEGALVFFFRPTPVFQAVAQSIDGLRVLCGQFNGWFSDEWVHYRNSIANLADTGGGKRAVLTRFQDLNGGTPAIVVGSGPSLDDDIAHLRAVAGRSTVISCGTALEALLAAGITPDFHCELENVAAAAEIVRSVSQRFDLSGITLLASTTVSCALPALFERTLFFLREGDGTCVLLREHLDAQPLSGRTAVCSAVSFAMHIGCRTIALLGVDLAYREGHHHAEGVSAYKSGEHGKGSGRQFGMFDTAGNFRTSVSSNGTWTFMRKGLEDLAAQANGRFRLVNCSDGARIGGFEAEKLADLSVALPGDKKAFPGVVEGLAAADLLVEPGEALQGMETMGPLEDLLLYWSDCKKRCSPLSEIPEHAGTAVSFFDYYAVYAMPLVGALPDPNPLKTVFLFFLRKALFSIRTRYLHLAPAVQGVFVKRAFALFETVGDSVMMEVAYQIDKGQEHRGLPFTAPEALDAERYARYRARRDTGLNSACCTVLSTDVDGGEHDFGKRPRSLSLPYPDLVEDLLRQQVGDYLLECHRSLRDAPCDVCGGDISWNIYPNSTRLEGACVRCGNGVVHWGDDAGAGKSSRRPADL